MNFDKLKSEGLHFGLAMGLTRIERGGYAVKPIKAKKSSAASSLMIQ